ncbi:Ba158.2 [Baboon cytomegalovirus]|nr:Ba158.2 [Baboon cytomegalovirus]
MNFWKAATVPAALLVMFLVFSKVSGEQSIDLMQRCWCSQTTQGIGRQHIKSLQLRDPTDMCPKTELIATLTDGREVCLNPEAPMSVKMISKIKEHEKDYIKKVTT